MNNHRIPNEFSRSDKLGPFTMPQAVVLGVGAMIFLVFLLTVQNLIVLALIFIVIATLTLGMMYIRIDKLPAYEFLVKWLMFQVSPKLLIYRSDNMKKLDMEDELIGFQESVIAENTVKEIKTDGKKKKNEKSKPSNQKTKTNQKSKSKSVKKNKKGAK